MTTIEAVRTEWEAMRPEGVAKHRLFDSHPLHLYFGVNAAGDPMLLLITDTEPGMPALTGIVETLCATRADGKYATTISLGDGRYRRAFIGMCLELARTTQAAGGEHRALHELVRALFHWRKLFTGNKTRHLTDAQIRGLVAELHFAVTHLTPEKGIAAVVDAWVGPLGAPQDFRFEERLFEVKSVRAGSGVVKVSSVGQLDAHSPGGIVLVTVEVFDDSFGVSPDSRSLAEWAAEFERLAEEAPAIGEVLESRWAALGFDPRDEAYADKRFTVGETRLFAVASGFPILRAISVPPEVMEVSYKLRTDGLEKFRLNAPFEPWEGGVSPDVN